MAKGYRKPKRGITPPGTRPIIRKDGDPDNSFRTPAGRLITFEPANSTTLKLIESGVTLDFQDRGEPLDPPTYTVATAGGGSQVFAHDEKSIQGNPELEELWKQHREAVTRLNNEINVEKFKYALECVTNQLPEDESWIARQKSHRIRIPEDPELLRQHYITTELIRTPEDSIILFMEVTTAGLRGVINEDDIQKVRENFRSIVPVPNGNGSIVDRLSRAAQESRREVGA